MKYSFFERKNGWNIKDYSFDYVKENFQELDFYKIMIDPEIQILGDDISFTDLEHPIIIAGQEFVLDKCLGISQKYYDEHKEEVDSLIENICMNKRTESLYLRSHQLVTDRFINAILSNDNVKTIGLGSGNEPYALDKELYEKIKKSHITSIETSEVSDELKENFDPIIGFNRYRRLVGFYTYEQLAKSSGIYITEVLSTEEIDNLKFVPDNIQVKLSSDNYENIFKIIKRFNDLGRQNKIILDFHDKKAFNSFLFNNLDNITTNNVYVGSIQENRFTLLEYINYEKRLYEMIKPAMDLSPFEKYLFAYNVTKKYKPYKENEKDKNSSRNLYKLLDGEYMVCVGYSALLIDLLDKLGIEAHEYSNSVDVGMNKIPRNAEFIPEYVEIKGVKKEVKGERGGHARVEVNLIDPKYGIDGLYLADPTWDNDMEHDTYSYALLTREEYNGIHTYSYFGFYVIDELFTAGSLEEFYAKVNIWLDKGKQGPYKKGTKDLVHSFKSYLKNIDFKKYSELKNKYDFSMISEKDIDPKIFQEFILDMGEYILSRTNNIIKGSTFKEGIKVIYRDCYGYDDPVKLEETIDKVMEYNKRAYAIRFPKRYKIDFEGNRIVYQNENNKFDLDDKNLNR